MDEDKFKGIIPNNISYTEFLLRGCEGHEDRVGMIDGGTGEEWSFGQIRRNIHNIGSALSSRGVNKGHVIALMGANSLEHMAAIFAVPAIGGIATGISPVYTCREIIHQVRDSGAAYIICDVDILAKVKQAVTECPEVKEIFVLGEAAGHLSIRTMMEGDGTSMPHVEFVSDSDLAFLPYSSGTTGLPKGVMLSHRALMVQRYMFSQGDKYSTIEDHSSLISLFPLTHIAGLTLCASSIYQRCKCVIFRKFDFESFLKLIEKYKTSLLTVPPPVALRLTKDPLVGRYDISSVGTLLAGSAPISRQLQQDLATLLNIHQIRQVYGMTETCGGLTISPNYQPMVHGSAGQCHPLINTKIMDIESGRELQGRGERGELWVKSPSIMKGYWRDEAKTRATINEHGWLHTGDVAYTDNNDNIFIVDRLKEIIKYKGFQVAPAELEALLLTHPHIGDAAVVGVPDVRAGEVPAAYVVLKQGCNTEAADIVTFVTERVAPYKQLRGGVYFRKSIPKTHSGKILRKVIREEINSQMMTS